MAREEAVARKAAARDFADRWKGRGYEKGDTASFWLELLRDVVGMTEVTTNVRFEDQTVNRGFIDVTIRDAKTIVEQKSLGVDLDKPEMRQGTLVTPFEQAKRYADSLRNSERPDTIIVSDFNEFRIHDLDVANPQDTYVSFTLAELADQLHLLDFLIDPQLARRKREEQVSLDAGLLIGKLYDKIRGQYHDPDSAESMHSLNVLCVRLVFLLFAEDAGLFTKDAFYRYLKPLPAQFSREALKQLFAWLNTPEPQRDPYAAEQLKAFPYVNGGLFAAEVEIPNLTQEIVDFLLDEVSEGTNWSEISPTVFGGVFESTLNPETRRKGGMHYTSQENIHKLIGPLFLDDLKDELETILTTPGWGDRKRKNELEKYHDKIAGLHFFDPACGSGNFLTETYIQLRKLENKVLSELMNHQGMFAFDEEHSPLKVSLHQFHGIEINDFAVNVATTAMWIAQLQANAEAQSIVYSVVNDLPLQDAAHVVHGNALRIDWNEVIPARQVDYVIGNPPFVGRNKKSPDQVSEMQNIWGKLYEGNLDYVTSWFKKTADYLENHTDGVFAFVATNSITQGIQVPYLWKPLAEAGWRIRFAHQTFAWEAESTDMAHVHVVIIAMDRESCHARPPRLFTYENIKGNPTEAEASHVNGYLIGAPDIFIEKRSQSRGPLGPDLSLANFGSMPRDGGNLLIDTREEYEKAMADPIAARYVRPFRMGKELINGLDRWCLWLVDAEPSEMRRSPFIATRLSAVKEMRDQSDAASTRAMSATPWLFGQLAQPNDQYLAIPSVFSERREYATCDLFTKNVIAGNKIFTIIDPDGLNFAIIQSAMFITWQKSIGGRLKTDCNFSNTVVWNNLPLPQLQPELKARICKLGKQVRDVRKNHIDSTLADLYDPLFMPNDLRKAHQELDKAVDVAFGAKSPCFSNEERLHVLFNSYATMTR